MAGYTRLVRSALTAHEERELTEVDALADSLAAHLDRNAAAIDAVHIHRAQSSAVQRIVARLLQDQLGFVLQVVIVRRRPPRSTSATTPRWSLSR